VVTGGLRAYNHDIMPAAKKSEIEHHWQEVHRRTGLPFRTGGAMADPNFVYDTEPACRAVVTARELSKLRPDSQPNPQPKPQPDDALTLFRAIQFTFYAEGRDTTDAGVLIEVARSVGFDRRAFADAFASEAMQIATEDDFALARQWGVSGFPTLVAEHEGQRYLVARGYTEAATLAPRLLDLVAGNA
jgi:putative protein-disulfide isomerase